MSTSTVGAPASSTTAHRLAAIIGRALPPWPGAVQVESSRASGMASMASRIWPARNPTHEASESTTKYSNPSPTPRPDQATSRGGEGRRRDGIRPASAGTSAGPSDISSVTTGALRAWPCHPRVSASPAPSPMALAVPQATASSGGSAATAWTSTARGAILVLTASASTASP